MDLEIGLGVTNMKEVWLIRSIGLPSPALVNQYLNVLVLLEEDLVGVAGTGFSDSLEEITILFLFFLFFDIYSYDTFQSYTRPLHFRFGRHVVFFRFYDTRTKT